MKLAELILEQEDSKAEEKKEEPAEAKAAKDSPSSPALQSALKELFSAAKEGKQDDFAESFVNAMRIFRAEED